MPLDIKQDISLDVRQDKGLDIRPDKGLDIRSEGEKKPIFESGDPGQEFVLQGLSRGVNTAAFGIPGFVAGKAGFEIPEPQTPAGRIGAGVGQLAGFVGGGAIKVGSKVAAKALPKILTNPTLLKSTGLVMGRNAISLGVASGLMTPEEGLFAPVQRSKAFGAGAVQGVVFGGLSFIPNTPARIVANASAFGVPSTLAQEPLEMQVFNYGLGAYFGRKGLSAKQTLKQQQDLSALVDKGMLGKDARLTLKGNQELLANMRKDAELSGKAPFTAQEKIDQITGDNGTNVFAFDKKGKFLGERRSVGKTGAKVVLSAGKKQFRGDITKEILARQKDVRQRPSRQLRFDDVDFVLANFGTEKSLSKLTDRNLNSINELLKQPPPPPREKAYRPGLPRELGVYDEIFRPNYAKLQKMGLGNVFRDGLTNELVINDVGASTMLTNHIKLTDGWKKTIGMRGSTARNIFSHLDGKISDKQLTKIHGDKALEVSSQMRQYLDTLLISINRQKAKFNEPKIERRKNYITHVFDSLQKEKKNLPFEVEQSIDFITARRKFNPSEIKRRGKKEGFSTELWDVMDVYAQRSSHSSNDDFIRKTSRYKKFLVKQRALKKQNDQTFEYDVEELIRNVDLANKEISGRPGRFDKSIGNSMKSWNKWMDNLGFGALQVDSVSKLSHFATTMIYGTQMGYRPKLALRNLGQHSLIIGRTGFTPLGQALKAPRTPELLGEVAESLTVQSRARAFAPQADTLRGFVKSGMWMFQKADMKNVVDAYLAGYFSVSKGKILKKGNPLRRKAIIEGDKTAGLTQFLYLNGNRNGLARGLGLSRTLRPLSIFTTWPTNYMEFIMTSARPEHRANLFKYIGTSMGFIGLTALAGIKGINYTGLNSPMALLDFFRLKFPIAGLSERPNVQIFNDIKKTVRDDDLRQLLFYTFQEE